MNYQEFVCAVISELNLKLQEGGKATLYTAVKNNGRERKGVMIEIPKVNISPTIYLEEFYERFRKGSAMGEIIEEILDFYDSVKCLKSWDASWITEYNRVRDKIVFKLINTKKNSGLLQKMPHREMLDLSIVFYILLEMDGRGISTMPVDEDMMKGWGVSPEILYRDGLNNGTRLLSPQLLPMTAVMEEFMRGKKDAVNLLTERPTKTEGELMYVLTNEKRNFGAACALYPGVLEQIGELLGEDYFVLPSSVHEMVIVPKSYSREYEEMENMVKEINEAEVAEEELLSNHAYFYRREEKRLEMKQTAAVQEQPEVRQAG